MKPKTLTKKLVLNKSTLSDLNREQMKDIKGQGTIFDDTCMCAESRPLDTKCFICQP